MHFSCSISQEIVERIAWNAVGIKYYQVDSDNLKGLIFNANDDEEIYHFPVSFDTIANLLFAARAVIVTIKDLAVRDELTRLDFEMEIDGVISPARALEQEGIPIIQQEGFEYMEGLDYKDGSS